MRVSFVSLGCAKNVVNCEQMMALCRDAGFELCETAEGCDVAVVNTCGFLSSANEEAIEHVLRLAELKSEGKLKKILVSGCMTERYRGEVMAELPEVDGILGTGSYKDIVDAVETVMAGGTVSRFDDINAPVDEFARVLSTPDHYAYLRIAEGCDNWCAFCIIPKLRGKYRSRPMDKVLAEAKELAEKGVKELIVIAQDITRYGTDWDGKHHLAELLTELCKLDFPWIRLHYLYPDQMDDHLIEVIAREEKILKYLYIPLQHCNDAILKRMNRKGDKAYIEDLLDKLRERIPGLVLRTSIITGLPGEGEEEFEELCDFLRYAKIERAGVFPFYPEDGTRAALMDHVDFDVAQHRAELIMEIQAGVMEEFSTNMIGETLDVLFEDIDPKSGFGIGRCYADSPDIDWQVFFDNWHSFTPGTIFPVFIRDTAEGNLIGSVVTED